MLPRDGKKTVEPEAGICTIGSDGAEWNKYRDMGRQTEVWILVPLARYMILERSFSISGTHYLPFPGGGEKIIILFDSHNIPRS